MCCDTCSTACERVNLVMLIVKKNKDLLFYLFLLRVSFVCFYCSWKLSGKLLAFHYHLVFVFLCQILTLWTIIRVFWPFLHTFSELIVYLINFTLITMRLILKKSEVNTFDIVPYKFLEYYTYGFIMYIGIKLHIKVVLK